MTLICNGVTSSLGQHGKLVIEDRLSRLRFGRIDKDPQDTPTVLGVTFVLPYMSL